MDGGEFVVPMVMTSVEELVPAEFEAVRVTLKVPVVVGVPLISPLLLLKLRPGGMPDAESVIGHKPLTAVW